MVTFSFHKTCLRIPKRFSKLWFQTINSLRIPVYFSNASVQKNPTTFLRCFDDRITTLQTVPPFCRISDRQLYSCLLSAVPQSACLSVYQEIAVSSHPPAPPYRNHVVPHPSLSSVQRLPVQGFPLCNTSCLRL